MSSLAIDQEIELEAIEIDPAPAPATPNQLRAIMQHLEDIMDKIDRIERRMRRIAQHQMDEMEAEPSTSRAPKQRRLSCSECRGSHQPYECPRISAAERIAFAIKFELCLNCNSKHPGDCRRRAACNKCTKKHLSMYHA